MASSPAPAGPLPVGFRFRPTDEELVRHYLQAKISGRAHPDLLLIPDVDLSACEPWELPGKALIRSDDPEWFFFAPLDRKYPGGHRSNRSTAAGYWKATGKDRLIRTNKTLIGVKKTLVFHRGRAPRGQRTAWIMHEYRAVQQQGTTSSSSSFVLYRLFNKHDPAAAESEDSPPPPAAAAASIHNNHPAAAQQDDDKNPPLLDVLSQLPDLQPDQKYLEFPTIASPMRPYTDHPFVGNAGGQDLSAYIDSIIARQDLDDLLLMAKPDPVGNAPFMPSNSSNSPQTSCEKTDQLQLQSAFIPEMEQPDTGALCSAASWSPYPQHLFNNMVQPSGSDMTNSDVLNGWAAEPQMQKFTVSNDIDPQQGTAARRIRLVHSVQGVSEPVLTSHLDSEDEAGSCYSTEDSSSTNHNKDYANVVSQAMVGEAMRIQGGGFIPTQVVSSVEGKLRDSFDEQTSPHAKLHHEAVLKQRLKQGHTESSQNVHEGLQHSDRVSGEPSWRRRQPAPVGSVVRLLCLGLVVILAIVGLWKASLCKSQH